MEWPGQGENGDTVTYAEIHPVRPDSWRGERCLLELSVNNPTPIKVRKQIRNRYRVTWPPSLRRGKMTIISGIDNYQFTWQSNHVFIYLHSCPKPSRLERSRFIHHCILSSLWSEFDPGPLTTTQDLPGGTTQQHIDLDSISNVYKTNPGVYKTDPRVP